MTDTQLGFVGVLIGAVIALTSSFGLQYWMKQQEQSALKGALRAEIAAIGELAARREIGPAIDKAIESLGKTQTVMVPDISVGREYFIVYTNNAAKIGLLDPRDAADVARFYIKASAVIEDLNWLSSLSRKGSDEVAAELDKNDLQELKLLFNEATSLGNDLSKRLGDS